MEEKKREPGFYWVKRYDTDKEWAVAEWDEFGWWGWGLDDLGEQEPFVVGPRIEPPEAT